MNPQETLAFYVGALTGLGCGMFITLAVFLICFLKWGRQ